MHSVTWFEPRLRQSCAGSLQSGSVELADRFNSLEARESGCGIRKRVRQHHVPLCRASLTRQTAQELRFQARFPQQQLRDVTRQTSACSSTRQMTVRSDSQQPRGERAPATRTAVSESSAAAAAAANAGAAGASATARGKKIVRRESLKTTRSPRATKSGDAKRTKSR